MNAFTVSLVIPTHNRADRFRTTLDALAEQTFPFPQFEVVVVADGCRDSTSELVRSYPAPFRLRLVELPGNGAAQARNHGAAVAEGHLLIFMDDDIEVLPDFVAAHVAAHAEAQRRLVIGYLSTVLTGQTGLFRASLRRWWEEMFCAMAEPAHRFAFSDVLTGNLSLETALFRSLGGFDGTLRCQEDYEFGIRALKAGAQLHHAPDTKGFHHEHTNLDRTLARKRQEGKAQVQLGHLHPEVRPVLLAARLTVVADSQATLTEKLFARVRRVVRSLAFSHSKTGDRLAAGGRRLLNVFEAMRLRHLWRIGLDALMAYWYWRGMAEELSTVAALETFLSDLPTDAMLPEPLRIDLQAGVDAAERQLDRDRPPSAHLWYGAHWVGALPARPGSEGLRGIHLRAALAEEFADRYLIVLASCIASGDPALSLPGVVCRA